MNPLIRTLAGALCVLTSSLASVGASCAATFSISQPGGTWNTVYGQGFSPAVDSSPDLGLSSGDQVGLESFTFFKSGNSDSAADIQLAIFQDFYTDFGLTYTLSSPEVVGVSDNVIASTTGLSESDPIAFTFSGVELGYGEDYGAVFVTVGSGGELTPILVSALTGNYEEDAPGSGVYVPAPNYGGLDQYNYTASNFISGGYFAAFDRGGDVSFEAVFSAVPEPATALLVVASLVLLPARRCG